MNNTQGKTIITSFLAGAVAWALFGPNIKRKVNENEALQKLKSEVEYKVSQVKDVTKDQYDRIVDEVTTAYGKAKSISQNELSDLALDLKKHWFKIRTAWKNEPKSNTQTPAEDIN